MSAVPAIKSQPVYQPLQWDLGGAAHLLAGQGSGCGRIAELLEAAPQAASAFLALPGPGQAAPAGAQSFSSEEALLAALEKELAAARMGLRLYLAGTEGFLWNAAKLARGFGMAADEMRLEQCGSLERPVYCTHCKHVTQQVRTSIYTCPSCKRSLFVRDHFSRELAAYMAFQIDAEVPGQVPPAEEIYP